MKNILLSKLLMFTKYSFYGVFVQLVLVGMVLASETTAQKYQSVKDVNVALSLQDAHLKEVISAIEEKTGFVFAFDQHVVNTKVKINLNHSDKPVFDYLMEIARQTNLKFKQVNNLITISKTPTTSSKPHIEIQVVEDITITGKVTGSNKEALPGVSIIVKGTSNGVVSDLDGNYKISVPENTTTLVYSFVGYERTEIEISGRSEINVSMTEDISQLDEVVVVGYGTQQKAKVTGSVASIKKDVLIDRPIVSVSQGLAGVDPGTHVIVANAGGVPGEQPTISIRGEYANPSRAEFTQPLVLVDGFEANMNDVDPNQIEEMTILKDAASTAIYGVRAAAGVILITTKGGKRNQPLQFNYKFQAASQGYTSVPETLGTVEYMEFRNKAAYNSDVYWANRNNDEDALNAAKTSADRFSMFSEDVINRARNGEFPDTNWQDYLYGDSAPQFSHSLDAYGGTENTNYMISLGFLDQKGVNVGNDNFKRYNLRVKIDTDVNDWLTLGTNTAFTFSEQNRVDLNTVQDDARPAPHFPVTDEFFGGSGLYVAGENGASGNMVMTSTNGSNDRTRRDVLETQLYAKMKLVKGLTFDQKLNIRLVNSQISDWSDNIEHTIYTFNGQTGEYVNSRGEGGTFGPFSIDRSLQMTDSRHSHLTSQSLLNYQYSLGGAHNFKALLGWQAEKEHTEAFWAYKQGFASGSLQRLAVGDNNDFTNNGSSGADQSLLSLFGRLNYDYKGRYMAEVSFRKDGTAQFADGNRWGFFPSLSVGWNMASEPFMTNLGFVDMLKLRGSIGETGNEDLPTSSLPYYTRVSTTTGYSWPNGGLEPGFRVENISNPNVIWETVKKVDVGIDLELWKGKLSLVADYYQNTRTDQLVALRAPRISGFGTAPDNLYETETKGWEVKVSHRNKVGDLAYNISLNASNARSLWSERPGDIQWDSEEVGWPLRSPFGYTMDGWISDYAELEEYNSATSFGNGTQNRRWIGAPRLLDIGMRNPETLLREGTPDERIDNWDRIQLGGGNKGVYKVGGTLGVSYKGASLTAVIDGTLNRDIAANLGPTFSNNVGNAFRALKELSFDPENPSDEALFPIALAGNWGYQGIPRISSSFIRVRNINLSYNVQQTLVPAISRIKIYISMENPVLLWNNSPLAEYGFDPELGNTVLYPMPRTTTIGLNIGF